MVPLSLVLPFLAAGALYARGVARVWSRAGIGRGVARGSVAAFQAG